PSDGWVRVEHPTAAAPADAAIFVLRVQPAADGPARIEVLRAAGLQGSISIAGATHCVLQAPAALGDGYVVQYQPPEYGTTRSTARRLDVLDGAIELAGLAFSEACREHWFQVGPFDAEQALALETLALRSCDTLVELYQGDDPLSLASDDDGGAELYASRLAYPAEPGVTYFVRLANYTGQPAGEYTLVASLSTD
ncbi:MAG TPA: hypothetical protein VJP77_06825, partial [Planctomycetota bacterium]|nr:hypothetical protein [Planctomycetota bacterium]